MPSAGALQDSSPSRTPSPAVAPSVRETQTVTGASSAKTSAALRNRTHATHPLVDQGPLAWSTSTETPFAGVRLGWSPSPTPSLAVAQNVFGTLTVNMDLCVKTKDASRSLIHVTPRPVAPTPLAWSITWATPFADARKVSSPNPTPSLAVAPSVLGILIAKPALYARTKDVLRSLIHATHLPVAPGPLAWSTTTVTQSAGVSPAWSQNRTPSLDVDPSASGIQTARAALSVRTSAVLKSLTPATPHPVDRAPCAWSTATETLSAGAWEGWSPSQILSLDVVRSVRETPNVIMVLFARSKFVLRPPTHVTPTLADLGLSAIRSTREVVEKLLSSASARLDHLVIPKSSARRVSVRSTRSVLMTKPVRTTTASTPANKTLAKRQISAGLLDTSLSVDSTKWN